MLFGFYLWCLQGMLLIRVEFEVFVLTRGRVVLVILLCMILFCLYFVLLVLGFWLGVGYDALMSCVGFCDSYR